MTVPAQRGFGTASRRQTARVEATAPNGCGCSCHTSNFWGACPARPLHNFFSWLSPPAYFSPFPVPTAAFTYVTRVTRVTNPSTITWSLIVGNNQIRATLYSASPDGYGYPSFLPRSLYPISHHFISCNQLPPSRVIPIAYSNSATSPHPASPPAEFPVLLMVITQRSVRLHLVSASSPVHAPYRDTNISFSSFCLAVHPAEIPKPLSPLMARYTLLPFNFYSSLAPSHLLSYAWQKCGQSTWRWHKEVSP